MFHSPEHEHAHELSPSEAVELSTDHLIADPPPDESTFPVSFDVETPASPETPLGADILAIAGEYLKMPLREDAGTNNDKQGIIKTFFLEGLKWSADTWDHWAEKYPKSGVAKPEWCAAFGSFCARKAYTKAGLSLPASPSGSASEMQSRFEKAKRFLARDAVYDSDGSIKEGATLPGPGDLVVWHGHVGILKEIFPSGAFTTIEGNTWRSSPRNDGVYQCQRNSLEKRNDGTYKLAGFCLLASVDGRQKEEAQEQTQAPAQAQAQEEEKEPEPAPSTAT